VIVVAEYDQSWQRRGSELAGEILAALAPQPLFVEHIGSTSIPGMAAKPVFDLQATVTDLDAVEGPFDAALTGLGFTMSPYRRDHVPVGYDEPADRWVKRLWTRRGQPSEVNLHVRLAGSPNERLALLFRDWFRAHPRAIPGYARFKQSLAVAVGDLDVYTDVKDNVVDLVNAVAEAWASDTGWAPHTPPVR
jgi:GrpB-like predicted nucleotidyltransferase (UPF0157 family)